MAGLFGGLVSTQSQQPTIGASLLGLSNSDYGILGSSIKDALAYFSGHPEGANSLLPAIQRGQQSQQSAALLSGITSPDPATRQQAYVAAAAMGIDPKPFQEAQASAALPQLLKNLGPQTVSMPATQAALPNVPGVTVSGGTPSFQADPMNLTDALAATKSPELQADYAPGIIKQKMEMQAKAVRPATADEKQAAGLSARTPALIDANGTIKPIADPNQITAYQQAELRNQAAGRALQQEQFGETRRHNQAMEGPSLGGPDSGQISPLSAYPQGVQSTVKAMLDGRQAPPTSMAMSKPYWQNLIAIANAQDPNFDQTTWGARASARKDFMGGGKSYQTLNSGNTAIQHLGRLASQIPDVAGHQIPLIGNMINSAENATALASGVPGVNAYRDTLGHLSEEATKFYRGTGGNETDIGRSMANLSDNLSQAQKQSGVANTVHLIYGKLAPMVEQYNKTMGTNFPASHFLSKEATKTMRNMGYDPDTGEVMTKSNLPPSPQNLPRTSNGFVTGQIYQDANGNKARFNNGQWQPL